MSTVVSIEAWKREREERDPSGRLARAVEALEDVLGRLPRRRLSDPAIERELLAITGAVSIGLLDDAADRAERLRERLVERISRGG